MAIMDSSRELTTIRMFWFFEMNLSGRRVRRSRRTLRMGRLMLSTAQSMMEEMTMMKSRMDQESRR
jgi:hypothetical protein